LGEHDLEGPPAATEVDLRGSYVTPTGADNRELARISEQLDELKRLMIVWLLDSGVQSAHIAKALDIHPSAISRMLPVREIQKVASRRGARSAESDG